MLDYLENDAARFLKKVWSAQSSKLKMVEVFRVLTNIQTVDTFFFNLEYEIVNGLLSFLWKPHD